MSVTIAPSAVVEAGAAIGDGTVIWDLTQIRAGASLGEGCVVGRNVFVDAGVVVGARCKIQNNALLYAPARLGDGVFIGPAVVLTNDRVPRAIDPQGSLKDAGGWAAAGVVVEDGASVGAGAVVVAGVTIGAWALIGAGAVVTARVRAHSLVAGNPARHMAWVGRTGRRLASDRHGTLTCPDTGARYELRGDHLEEIK